MATRHPVDTSRDDPAPHAVRWRWLLAACATVEIAWLGALALALHALVT
jgi:hypothetical protein